MVVTNNGKNRIRDLVVADIDNVTLGTGTTAPSSGDVALATADATSEKTPSITSANRTINVSHALNSAEGNGTVYTEGGIFINGGTVLLDRWIYPDFSKTNALNFINIDILRID